MIDDMDRAPGRLAGQLGFELARRIGHGLRPHVGRDRPRFSFVDLLRLPRFRVGAEFRRGRGLRRQRSRWSSTIGLSPVVRNASLLAIRRGV